MIETSQRHSSIRRQILYIVYATVALLLVPFVAMQFTTEVNWTAFDFLVMGFMLLSAGLAYVLISKLSDNLAYKAAVGIAVLAAFLLVWINAAVGLIGSENNPANLLYLGVIAVGIVGAALSGFRARGMMWALVAAAIAQFLVPLLAMLIWKPAFTVEETPGVVGVLLLNSFFAALFVVSALLFRRASEMMPPENNS